MNFFNFLYWYLDFFLNQMSSTEPVEEVKTEEENGDFVDPWNVASASDTGVNYDKLIGKFCLF